MKVVICAQGFPAPGIQSFVFVEQLVIALANRGHKIVVVAPQSVTKSLLRGISVLPKYEMRTTSEGFSFEIYRPKYFSAGKSSKFRTIVQWTLRKAVGNVLESLKEIPDVLYGHFWSQALLLRPFALKHKIPLFVACGEGDNALEDMVTRMSEHDKNALADSVAGVISVSSENKRKCLKYGLITDERIGVFPNSVEKSVFHPINKEECRKKLNIDKDDFVIAFVGAFITRKGSKRLSEAIDRINAAHLKAIFMGRALAGDDCTPTCQGIVHCGPVDHDDLPLYLNAADIFVLPTLKEGCCNAIVEALSCGLPVVSAGLPFNDDVLDETNGIRIDPTSVDEIEAAIRRLMIDKQLVLRLSAGALAKTENLSIDKRAEKIENFIKGHTDLL